MLLNLASYDPFFYKEGNFIKLERKDLENTLPNILLSNLDKHLYVITGPGYFSATRIGCEIVNIFSFFGKISNLFFLDKITLFQQYLKLVKNIDSVLLFSGNKNKFIEVSKDSYFFSTNHPIFNIEEGLEKIISNNKKILLYKTVLCNYKKKFKWFKAVYIKPFYIFPPITN